MTGGIRLAAAMIGIVLVLMAAIAGGSYLVDSAVPPSSSTSPSTISTSAMVPTTSAGAVYQTIRMDLTLQGQAAVMPCIGFDETSCPSATNATLSPVDLIEYGGNYYYLYNQTEAPSSSNATTYVTWFTNSSVFCISPAHPLTTTIHENPTCPVGSYQPSAVTIPVTSVSTSNSSLGLRLDLNLSSQSPGTITVSIDLVNMFNHINNLTANEGRSSIAENFYLWSIDGCGAPTDIPFGYAIFQGNISENDIFSGTPLSLQAQPGGLYCLVDDPTPYFAFYPLSDMAATYQWSNIASLAGIYNVTASTTCVPVSSSQCAGNGLETWSGYWTGSTQTPLSVYGGDCAGQSSSSQATSMDCPLTFSQFPAGVYTVAAVDEWGQTSLLHFTVTS